MAVVISCSLAVAAILASLLKTTKEVGGTQRPTTFGYFMAVVLVALSVWNVWLTHQSAREADRVRMQALRNFEKDLTLRQWKARADALVERLSHTHTLLLDAKDNASLLPDTFGGTELDRALDELRDLGLNGPDVPWRTFREQSLRQLGLFLPNDQTKGIEISRLISVEEGLSRAILEAEYAARLGTLLVDARSQDP